MKTCTWAYKITPLLKFNFEVPYTIILNVKRCQHFDSFLRASLLTTLVYPFPVKLMNNVKFKALLEMSNVKNLRFMQENDRCYSLKIIRFEFKTRHNFEIYNPWFLIIGNLWKYFFYRTMHLIFGCCLPQKQALTHAPNL